MKNKSCPNCNKEISGRSDKIYCDPYCKSAYQYEKRQTEESMFFEIDRQLKTNRKILKKYNRMGKSTLRKNILEEEGFNPNFFTHFWKNNKGDVYLFCYEFGFLALKENNKDKYLLVIWQKYMKK
jgi:hypothetical protein